MQYDQPVDGVLNDTYFENDWEDPQRLRAWLELTLPNTKTNEQSGD